MLHVWQMGKWGKNGTLCMYKKKDPTDIFWRDITSRNLTKVYLSGSVWIRIFATLDDLINCYACKSVCFKESQVMDMNFILSLSHL